MCLSIRTRFLWKVHQGYSTISSQSEHIKLLVRREKNNILIPGPYHIYSTFLKCQSIWRIYVARANSQPPGYMTAGSLNPCNLLQNMPPLPQSLPREGNIVGQSVWHIASPIS